VLGQAPAAGLRGAERGAQGGGKGQGGAGGAAAQPAAGPWAQAWQALLAVRVSQVAAVLPYALLVLVLVFRPRWLFGRREA